MVFIRGLICALLFVCASAWGQSARTSERRAIIDAASQYVGVKETGHNRGEPVKLFMTPYGYPAGTAWCALFVHHCYVQAGVPHGVKGAALSANWSIPAKVIICKAGRSIGGKKPLAGDLALFRFGSSRINHIELIVRWNGDDDYFYSIGGNTSNPANPAQEGVFLKKRAKRETYLVVNRLDII